ncbi:hypothetical protein CHS0354_034178 [Potamilus streckersoni]|uniref:Heat shock 70 kDa protein 12A n=1 Tax=Potamilus streckersoni TaxID=2493646 RepID=A0AAE0RMY1_9BIVA|nr:hypothetical protein CHS0354_034178 [Potamilus streckersoni]
MAQSHQDSWSTALVVVAMDIGTAFSGYALSFVDLYLKKSINDVQARQWRSSAHTTGKTPTCVLCKPNKEFDSFGYDAENKFASLAEKEEHQGWYFFQNFKMRLYQEKNLDRNIELIDVSGTKRMPALDVFAMSIKFLKDDAIHQAQENKTGLSETDFYWILTVPAIWSDKSKQFMREAAEKAGIEPSQLRLALEPECASVFCREISIRRSTSNSGNGANFLPMESGTRYMVIDMGGGTIDVTVHETTSTGALKELHQASGGDWGATKVNEAFNSFMVKMFGVQVWKEFRETCMEDFFKFTRDFEQKKYVPPEDQVNIPMPVSLIDLHRKKEGCELEQTVASMPFPTDASVSYRRGKLTMNAAQFKERFFGECIKDILDHIKKILGEVPNLKRLLLVGGFSECSLVKNAIKREFPHYTITVPEEAATAVLRGAILYGRDPSVIKSRICKFTYGFDWSEEYNPMIHPRDKRIDTDDGPYCSDIFKKLVEVGQEVNVGHCSDETETFVTYKSQERIAFPFYKSTQKSPRFVTDEGCTHIGTLYMDVPYSREGVNRSVFIQVQFGGTEITAKVRDRTGHRVKSARFDLL